MFTPCLFMGATVQKLKSVMKSSRRSPSRCAYSISSGWGSSKVCASSFRRNSTSIAIAAAATAALSSSSPRRSELSQHPWWSIVCGNPSIRPFALFQPAMDALMALLDVVGVLAQASQVLSHLFPRLRSSDHQHPLELPEHLHPLWGCPHPQGLLPSSGEIVSPSLS